MFLNTIVPQYVTQDFKSVPGWLPFDRQRDQSPDSGSIYFCGKKINQKENQRKYWGMKGGSDSGWLAAYLPAAWAGHICQVCWEYMPGMQNMSGISDIHSGPSQIHSFICKNPLQQKLTRLHILQGLAMGILGPTQPYLAKQVFSGITVIAIMMIYNFGRWVCPITRSASYGPAERLVTARRRSSPALSSGLLGWGC